MMYFLRQVGTVTTLLLLWAVQPATAAIIYSGQLNLNGPNFAIDINNDGSDDFTTGWRTMAQGNGFSQHAWDTIIFNLNISYLHTKLQLGSGAPAVKAKLEYGEVIGPNAPQDLQWSSWSNDSMLWNTWDMYADPSTTHSGDWNNTSNSFIGFWLQEPTGLHYGWMQLEVDAFNNVLLVDYAYEDQADIPIIAGMRSVTSVLLENGTGTVTTIQQAYDSIDSGQADTIKVKAGDQLSEDLLFDRDVTIRLEGGYDSTFTNLIGDTSFYGSLKITAGTVIISDLTIKGSGSPPEPPPVIDSQPPSIIQSSLDETSNFHVSDSIDIIFSEKLDDETINEQTIFIEGYNGLIASDITVNDETVSIKPSYLFHLLSNYSLSITRGIEDLAGNRLDQDYYWDFFTGDGQWTSPHSIGSGDNTLRLGMDEKGHAIAVWRAGGLINASYFNVLQGWSEPQLISGESQGSSPAIAMNAQGDAIVVWRSSTAFPTQIYSNVYIQDLGWQGVEIVATEPDIALSPNVVIDNKGNGVVTWNDGDGVIFLSQYLIEQGWGGAQKVSSGTNYGSDVDLATNADGKVVIAWRESIHNSDTNRFDNRLMAQFYNSATGWGPWWQIEYSEDDISAVDVDIDAYGNAIIAYVKNYEVYAKRWSKDTGWELTSLISDNANWSRNNLYPMVKFDHAGGAMLIWADWGGVRDHKIYSKRYNLNSGWGELDIVSATDSGRPYLSVDYFGNAIAITQTYPDIFVNRYIADQGWIGPVSLVEEATAMDLVMAQNGTAILGFESSGAQQVIHFE